VEDKHLITVDELRAAGALDVPASWRKSLRVEPDLFSGEDEDMRPEEQGPPARDAG
jgi:hypothetical protein